MIQIIVALAAGVMAMASAGSGTGDADEINGFSTNMMLTFSQGSRLTTTTRESLGKIIVQAWREANPPKQSEKVSGFLGSKIEKLAVG